MPVKRPWYFNPSSVREVRFLLSHGMRPTCREPQTQQALGPGLQGQSVEDARRKGRVVKEEGEGRDGAQSVVGVGRGVRGEGVEEGTA